MSNSPDWVRRGAPINVSDVPKADCAYLAKWVTDHSQPAQDYVLGLYAKHDVVILGEFHNIREHKEFVIQLIPRLYHEAGVRVIGWEFSRYADNARLEQLVTADEYDREAALNFARDQFAHEWDSKEHWDIIEAVWRLNKGLAPGQERLRLAGLNCNADFTQLNVALRRREDSPEYREAVKAVLPRDGIMAQQVEKEILEKRQKGLVFVGRCHDYTHYEFPPSVNLGRDIMGRLLYKKHGERVFQVYLGGGNQIPLLEGTIMRMAGDANVGFDLYASPFARIVANDKWVDAPGEPFENTIRGYVYFGPARDLHKNTPIKGFVTDEMFNRYRNYYETDFGRKFNSAQEVDAYFQANRFHYNAPKE